MSDVVLTPLADRVLIRPAPKPTETASGLALVQDWTPDQTGTVVAIGRARHPLHDVASSLAHKLRTYARSDDDYADTLKDAARLLLQLTAYEPSVQVGDEVIFSWRSGQELVLNQGESRFILLKESDVLAVME